MAQIFPPLNTLGQKQQPPTEGEMALLEAIQKYLPNDCEVFFQPYLNGDRPDIVILRKGYGVHIIEVKDWKLDSYAKDRSGTWMLKKNLVRIKSPIDQVECYKQNLYDLHVAELLELKTKNPTVFGIVTCSVYFHNARSFNELQTVNVPGDPSCSNKTPKKCYTKIYFRELLGKQQLCEFLEDSKLCRKSEFFRDDLYNNIRRLLQPPYHYLEEGIEIIYSKEQEKLIQSREGARQKIKGVAGSGKSLVLAKRAVNAYKRTDSPVLILTFNITLINYIHDLISNVREGFSWDAFEIVNYHLFFNSYANRHNLSFDSLGDYQDEKFFDRVASGLTKYKTILIDEAQDYREEWIRIIIENFLADNGEFVVFADEKQNIYDNKLDDEKKVRVPGIKGAWNESMNKTFRFSGKIVSLIRSYQNQIFTSKYTLDKMESVFQSDIDFGDSNIEYQLVNEITQPTEIATLIRSYLVKMNIHPSDVTVLNSRTSLLRDIDYYIRPYEKTSTTCETKEMYELLCSQYANKNQIRAKLETIRRNKKIHFRMKTGTMKLSTIHSFKGWEIHTAVVLIESEDSVNEFETAELIYTGLTRARTNLFIINIGNLKYHQIMLKVI